MVYRLCLTHRKIKTENPIYISKRTGVRSSMQETAENSRVRYWQRFENTGRVEDYLRYTCGGGAQEVKDGKSGADPNAGFYYSNWNDIEADAYR